MAHPSTSQMGVLMIGDHRTITGTDPSLAQLLSFHNPSIIGLPAADLLQGCLESGSFTALWQNLDLALRSQTTQSVRIRTLAGQDLECQLSPLIAGQTGAAVLVFSPLCACSTGARAALETELRDRTTELYCMYAFTRVAVNNPTDYVEFLNEVVRVVPDSWQHPELAYARIVLDGQVFESQDAPQTEWRLRKDILISGQVRGWFEVGYRDISWSDGSQFFLPFEEELLVALAARLSLIIARILNTMQLQAAEARYRNLVEHLPVVIYTTTVGDIETTYLSPQFEQQYGYPVHEFLGGLEVWAQLIVPEDRQRVVDEVHRWMEKAEVVFNSVYRLCARDGSIKWVHDIMNPIRSEDGRLLFYQGILVDITDRKNLEVALAESEEDIRTLFETMPQGVIYFSPDGAILNANPAAQQILEFSLSEVHEKSILDANWSVTKEDGTFCPPDTYPVFQALQTGRPVLNQVIKVQNLQSQAYRWIRASAIPQFHSGEDRPYKIYTAIEDITQIKDLVEALQARETQFTFLVEQLPAVIFATDLNMQVTTVAGSGLSSLGYQGQEFVGMALEQSLDRLGVADLPAFMKTFRTALAGECVAFEAMFDNQTYQEHAAPFRNSDGQIVGIIGLALNITEKKAVERALQESEAKFRSVVQNAWDGIVLLDEQGRVTEWNRGQQVITGIQPEQTIGRPIWEIQSELSIPGQSRPLSSTERQAMIENILFNPASGLLGKLVDQEYRHTDGSNRVMQSMIFPIEFDHTRLICSVSRDVTEQKHAAQAIQQHNRELGSLLKISQKLTSQHDFDRLLYDICASIVDTIPNAQAALLMLYDEHNQQLKPNGWYGYPDEVMHTVRFSIDQSLAGRMMRSRQPHIIADARLEPDFQLLGDPALDCVRSSLGAPLIVNEHLIGAIFADNLSHTNAFDVNDLYWLQSLAGQVAILIENTRLFREISQAKDNLHRLSRKLVDVQEMERRHIARELHDEVGQTLTGIKLMLEMAARPPSSPQSPNDQSRSSLVEIHHEVNNLIAKTRDLSLSLRPPVLDDFGLLEALYWHFGRFGSQTGLKIEFQHTGIDRRRFPGEIETVAFRVIQEALTNVIRHAKVQEAAVTLNATSHCLEIHVQDQGAGFDLNTASSKNKTFGLSGMRERVMLLGGHITIQSSIGHGTRLFVNLPLSQAQ